MEPILKTVARRYAQRYHQRGVDIKRICFLFPNKRCGVFLRKYFGEFDIFTEELPHILTISEFLSQVSKLTEAGRIEQLFSLYNSYLHVLGNEKEENDLPLFDSFRGWGETVLSDFNIVDVNLVDPKEIFKNVKDFREITSNFLTEEQKEVMREYFGVVNFDENLQFWKSFENPDELTGLRKEFLNLWQILYSLYTHFENSLNEKGLGSAGHIYRKAAGRILDRGREALPYKKIVAVGFNALSESERAIFRKLQKEPGYSGFDDFIDFIWDAEGPFFESDNFTAGRFVNLNNKHFPMPMWWRKESEENKEKYEFPEIRVISSPSNTAQAKIAGEILEKYGETGNEQAIKDSEVALILPDETLLPNILFSLPDNIGDINLTMGISLRDSSISSFMYLLRRLYATSRENKKGMTLYSKDLKMLFSHPYSYILFDGEKIAALLQYISDYHRVTLTLEDISQYLDTEESFFKFPVKKSEGTEVFSWIRVILETLEQKIEENEEKGNSQPDKEQIKIYREYVESLEETVTQYKVKASPLSFMQLTEKIVGGEKIGFEGEPLCGLQIMGTLETRSLDFSEIIILSLNEGIMPRKAVTSSFIPESLRRAYGLPPARYTEEIFSYYFYRLLSRAKKVTLIYDGRTLTGLRGAESRYILQLRQYMPKDKFTEETWQFHLQNRPEKEMKVKKTDEIRNRLEAYTTEGKNRKNFSASSLNTYRECQVKFFFQNVLNLNSDPAPEDFMDPISVGNILHEVMMELYMPENMQRRLLSQPLIVEQAYLESILNSPGIIKNLIDRNIRRLFYRVKEEGKSVPQSGVTEILAHQIQELVTEIVKNDLKLAPFKLYGCEISRNIRVKLKNGREVNFRFAIDRLDEIIVDGLSTLRIVDYKTGSKKRKAQDIEEIFDGGYQSEQIFQLFTYAWLLGKIGFDGWRDVSTEIYYVPDMVKGVRGLPEIGREPVESFAPFFEEFDTRLEDMIEGVFSDDTFESPENAQLCGFCAFRTICGR